MYHLAEKQSKLKIKSLKLKNFRNYELLNLEFDGSTNIFYGDNAQGKTNILEAVYLSGTTKSHRGSKDRDMIRFGAGESHIEVIVEKRGIQDQIDMHLKKNRPKGVAINKIPIRKAGELFEIKDNVLRVASLDGHRISIRKIELKNPVSDYKMVVPGKTLIEISKILSGEAESMVEISYTNNHIVFEFDNTIVVSRLIEGDYFKIDQMLSSDYDTKVRINKKEFLNCIDRATLLIKEGDKKPIIIDIQDEMMELKIKSQIGSMNEEIMISKDGKDLLIGFNPKFLIDALRVIDDEEVTLYLMNAKAPCFIKDETESYIYLILPVNFNANV